MNIIGIIFGILLVVILLICIPILFAILLVAMVEITERYVDREEMVIQAVKRKSIDDLCELIAIWQRANINKKGQWEEEGIDHVKFSKNKLEKVFKHL